jgi:predicted transcriptional regulator
VKYLKTISVRIEDAEKEMLTRYAEENDVAVSWLVRQLIKDFLKSQNTN